MAKTAALKIKIKIEKKEESGEGRKGGRGGRLLFWGLQIEEGRIIKFKSARHGQDRTSFPQAKITKRRGENKKTQGSQGFGRKHE